MRLLRVLDLAVVAARRGRDVRRRRTARAACVARRRERRLRQRRRVGAHVGDVAVLVEPLGDPHRRLRGEAELAARLLLQRRGHERRGSAGGVYGLRSTERTANAAPSSASASPRARVLVELNGIRVPRSVPSRAEVAALRDALAVERDEPRLERVAGRRCRDDVPVLRRDERHPLALALDDEPGRDRLHAAGGEAAASPSSRGRARPRSRRGGRGCGASPARRRAGRRSRGSRRARARIASRRDLVEDHPPDRAPSASAPATRCQAIASPSRSSSVASRSSSASARACAQLATTFFLVRVDDVERLELVRRRRRRAAPRPASCAPRGSRRRCRAGRGCGRSLDSTTNPSPR